MTLQLRIVAIFIALVFLYYVFSYVRKEKAEFGQVRKWLFLSIIMLLGAIFSNVGTYVAHFVGLTSYAYFVIFLLVLILLLISFRFQLTLIKAEKQIFILTQEVSLLKQKNQEKSDDKK
ncbi:MAG: DUF2304 domain-containing protein [Streptococcaceae bacterium]|jgi:hypothetical protein|nr:DUF2304 domain-containing protein [Streptococcaceae bacterium]